MKYKRRIIEKQIKKNLEIFGAINIEGIKQCGKTTTAQKFSKTLIKLQDPDNLKTYKETIEYKPSLLLEGEKPLLIDEWQDFPIMWDAVRTYVDSAMGKKKLFILTGSSTHNKLNTMHTGTGRIHTMKMYPMSLYETGESSGKISLQDLFDKKIKVNGLKSNLSFEDLAKAICRGGWPSTLNLKKYENQIEIPKDYVNQICNVDISKIDNIKRSPEITRRILKSYARNVATLATSKTLIKDCSFKDEGSKTTFYDYTTKLEDLNVIDNITAWNPKIRSASAIRSTNKRLFVDPSLATSSLGISYIDLIKDLRTYGFVFENLCSRDLKIYSSSLNGELSYYHDRYGLEIDFVLHLNDGRYALIECKLGGNQIEKAKNNLLKVKQLIKENGQREPDLMIILTAEDRAYEITDGILIIPISLLKD